MNEQLKKRILSFAWRLCSYMGVAGLAFIAENIGVFELPEYITVIVALICGEITKQLNSRVNYAK